VHVVWSRIDLDTLRAIPDSHNFRRHEIVSRELEREFGHARVQGAHIEREGDRPARTPTHAEMQQAERSGIDRHEAKAQLTEIWNRTDSGKAFSAAIEEQGWMLARGDRRDFVVVDQAGEVFSLARSIDRAKAKDIRQRMADLDAGNLPTVRQAKKLQLGRQREHPNQVAEIEKDQHRETGDRDQEQRGPSIGTTSGGMVAQQAEALWRFKRSSADLTQRPDHRPWMQRGQKSDGEDREDKEATRSGIGRDDSGGRSR
jgi:hypothetical protein